METFSAACICDLPRLRSHRTNRRGGVGSERIRQRWLSILLGAGLAGGMASLAYFVVNWNEIGRCLLGLVLLYLAVQAVQRRNNIKMLREG